MEPLEDPGTGTALSTEFAVGLVADAVIAYEFAAHAVSKLDGSDRLPRSNSLAPAPLAAEILHWMRHEREREREQSTHTVSIKMRSSSGTDQGFGEISDVTLAEHLAEDLGDKVIRVLEQDDVSEAARTKWRELRADRAATEEDIRGDARAFSRFQSQSQEKKATKDDDE